MHKNIHQGLAILGWIIVIAASLAPDDESVRNLFLLKGIGYGLAIMSSLVFYLIRRTEKNESGVVSNNNLYRVFAVVGMLIYFLATLSEASVHFMTRSLGVGIAVTSYHTIILINRQEKNETTSR